MCLSCTSAQVSGAPYDGRGGRDVIKGAPTSFAKEKLVDPHTVEEGHREANKCSVSQMNALSAVSPVDAIAGKILCYSS